MEGTDNEWMRGKKGREIRVDRYRATTNQMACCFRADKVRPDQQEPPVRLASR